MARRGGKGGHALKYISLRIVVVNLENPSKDLESSYQKSVGTLQADVHIQLRYLRVCPGCLFNIGQ